MVSTSGTAARELRIAEIKRQIAAGVYETPEKLEHAIEAFLGSRIEAVLDAEDDPERDGENSVPRPRPK